MRHIWSSLMSLLSGWKLKSWFFCLRLTPGQLDGSPIAVKFVKFQNVQNLQFFIKDNQVCSMLNISCYTDFNWNDTGKTFKIRIIEQACFAPQEGGEVTQIDYFSVVGTPIGTTNMNDFKRVQGKKGEAHWRTRGKNIPRIFLDAFSSIRNLCQNEQLFIHDDP